MTTTSTLITGVDFVTVPTDAFEASVAFYGETLGLPCIARYGKMPGAEFQAGNLHRGSRCCIRVQASSDGMAFGPSG